MLIYKITNKINNKVYIGQTIGTIEDRWSDHSRPHRGKNKAASAISKAILKYGKDNFILEVVAKGESIEELNILEIKFIVEHDCICPKGYNMLPGGNNKFCHVETRLKISNTLKGRPIKNRQNGAKKGRKCTWGEKIKSTMTGQPQPWKYKPVMCNETKEKFVSVSAAAYHIGIERTSLLYLLRTGGKSRKTKNTYSYIKETA